MDDDDLIAKLTPYAGKAIAYRRRPDFDWQYGLLGKVPLNLMGGYRGFAVYVPLGHTSITKESFADYLEVREANPEEVAGMVWSPHRAYGDQ